MGQTIQYPFHSLTYIYNSDDALIELRFNLLFCVIFYGSTDTKCYTDNTHSIV